MNVKRLRHELKLRRRLALLIHARTCCDRDGCNYGEPVPPELDDDKSLDWSVRKLRASERLAWYRHCQAAVNAENIAARVRFGQGARVRAK